MPIAEALTLHRSLLLTCFLTLCRHFNASRASSAQSPDAESEILRQQRKLRPVSPHLTIYEPQMTWVLSGLHRITGAAIGGGKQEN
jgi:succinate dehydrogenase (ubiquinone) cytochrome b560 subunit